MSLVPEYVLQAIIVRGLRTLRQDSRLLDQLFRNLDQQSMAEMRTFIDEKLIDLNINYPRTSLRVPAIIILLKSETEHTAFLGDSMGVSGAPDVFDYDDDLAEEPLEVLGGVASVSTMSGLGRVLFDAYKAAAGTNNTLKIGSKPWATSAFVGKLVRLIGGVGRGQTRTISANSENVIMVTPNWGVNPDETTIFDVREQEAEEVVGEPSALYGRHTTRNLERKGSLYALSYQMQVIGPNPELTIYLAAILKAILTLGRSFLEGQGVINMRLGATDFLPRTEYQPDFAYMRAVSVDFLYSFDVFEELGGLAEALQIGIETCPKGEDDASFTSFSVSQEPIIQTDSVFLVAAVSGSNLPNPGSQVTITLPTTILSGDFLVASVYRSTTPPTEIETPSPTARWRKVAAGRVPNAVGGTTGMLDVFVRPWVETDPAQFDFDVGELVGAVVLNVYRGVDRQDPLVGVSAVQLPSLQSSDSVMVASVRTVVGARIVATYAGTGSAETGWTATGDRVEETFGSSALAIFDEGSSVDGHSPAKQGTIASVATAGEILGHQMALRPVQPGPIV